MYRHFSSWLPLVFTALIMAGCASPYHSDQGTLFGGLFGAGTGAVVGHAMGNTGAGAAIGAGVGALSGAAVGANMDAEEARNRATAEQARVQQAMATAVTLPDVVNMTQAHVEERLIVDRIRTHGIAAPLQTNDVIYLHQQGVSANVIAAMQSQPVATAQPVQYYAPPGAMIVDENYYYSHPHYYYPPPRVGIGLSFRR